jgi:DNA-binding GntR family transcriptional regulator
MPRISVKSKSAAHEESGADTAYRVIKEEILSCRLRPGEVIRIEPYTRKLGLSRTPVREAILRLEKEGFVEVHPRLGTLVSRLDLRQIREMYQVRSLLEGAAARQVAGTIPAARIAALEQELRSYTLGENADLKAISQSGVKVHRLIVESCENRVLAGMIESLHEHFRRFRSLSLEIPAKVLSSHQDHLAILDALKRGDGEAAERLIHTHFERAVRFLLDSVISGGGVDVPLVI